MVAAAAAKVAAPAIAAAAAAQRRGFYTLRIQLTHSLKPPGWSGISNP
jgi:hypothetical protein